MIQSDFEKIVQNIVFESVQLKNKYVAGFEIKVEFCDVFAIGEAEFNQLSDVVKKLGNIIYPGPTGNIYSLQIPIETVAGQLHLVKIRKPDSKIRYRGDADFDTDYKKLKLQYQSHPHFELIIREKFEMLRLSDKLFNVMVCFSSIPVRRWISSSE